MSADLDLLIAAGISKPAAENLLRNLGSTPAIGAASIAELCAAGIPAKTAARLHAAFSIARRLPYHAADGGPLVASHSHSIFGMMRSRAQGLSQEIFWAIALDVRNQVIDIVEVARGHLTGVEVHPRESFRPMLRLAAAGVVFVHNHPSGDPTPSDDDLEITRRLREVGRIVIPVIDHIVITEDRYRSIAEHMGSGF